MFNQNPKEGETVWMPYSNVSLGLIGISAVIVEHIRLYGEGGTVLLFPSDSFSSKSIVVGGYGLFGFEFFMDKNGCYFIELGGIGTGAVADKVLSKPIYSNGFTISTGFRFYLK
jgi:hypothetical protein